MFLKAVYTCTSVKNACDTASKELGEVNHNIGTAPRLIAVIERLLDDSAPLLHFCRLLELPPELMQMFNVQCIFHDPEAANVLPKFVLAGHIARIGQVVVSPNWSCVQGYTLETLTFSS